MIFGQFPLEVRYGVAVSEFGDHARCAPVSHRQIGNRVVHSGLVSSDDYRGSSAGDDVERGLASHAGAAADHDDLLTLEL
jgi:hypothetical protein